MVGQVLIAVPLPIVNRLFTPDGDKDFVSISEGTIYESLFGNKMPIFLHNAPITSPSLYVCQLKGRRNLFNASLPIRKAK